MKISPYGEMTELHVHVGSAVDPPIMWEIAHEQGIKLSTKNYWEFEKSITVSDTTNYESYLELFYWTELIQSSPEAMEKSVYSIASGAYRKNNITTLEIRFNPMKRNRRGERDLDHIILAAIHGMEKAMIAFPLEVGLIFCLDRGFTKDLNTIIANKAIKYHNRGVVGIDVAGHISPKFSFEELGDVFARARQSGLGITIHTGEATGADEVKKVIKLVCPQRIGHGVRSVEDEGVLSMLAEKKIVLEVCPSSNINTRVVKKMEDFKGIFSALKKFGVPFTINTDGPEMLKTNLVHEYGILLEKKLLTREDLQNVSETARKASFLYHVAK